MLKIKEEGTCIYLHPPQQVMLREAHNYLAELVGRKGNF